MSKLTLDSERLKLFWYWMTERQRIYVKYKINGDPYPWTNDEIFQTRKFTNVFRELDRTTVWFRENWRDVYQDDPGFIFNVILFRTINRWETAQTVGYQTDYNKEEFLETLLAIRERGEPIYTGSHMLSARLIALPSGSKYPDKPYQSAQQYEELWQRRQELTKTVENCKTLEEAFHFFRTIQGIGPFISYEIVTDLRHTKFLKDAPDINTWANPGPGAMRGLNILLGFPTGRKTQQDRDLSDKPDHVRWPTKLLKTSEYLYLMRFLLGEAKTTLNLTHKPHPIELREIEHSLCEFYKYWKALKGERTKTKFVPPSERPQV